MRLSLQAVRKCALIKNMHLLRKAMPTFFYTYDHLPFCSRSVIRGHHVFKRVWTPVVSEVLAVKRETGNTKDRFVVSVCKYGAIVGHISRECSMVCWHFLRHDGRITCEVTGLRKRSSIEGKGLVVSCLYKFGASEKLIVWLRAGATLLP